MSSSACSKIIHVSSRDIHFCFFSMPLWAHRSLLSIANIFHTHQLNCHLGFHSNVNLKAFRMLIIQHMRMRLETFWEQFSVKVNMKGDERCYCQTTPARITSTGLLAFILTTEDCAMLLHASLSVVNFKMPPMQKTNFQVAVDLKRERLWNDFPCRFSFSVAEATLP